MKARRTFNLKSTSVWLYQQAKTRNIDNWVSACWERDKNKQIGIQIKKPQDEAQIFIAVEGEFRFWECEVGWV
jgi:hypothetical protein